MKSLSLIAIALIFGSCFSLSYADHTNVNNCKDSGQLPEVTIVIDDQLCVQPPCFVIPGTDAVMTINFTSPGYVPSITPQFLATYAGAVINYPTGQTDACDGIQNTLCPLGDAEFVSYVYALKLESWFPAVTVNLEASLINDDDKQVITCFSVDIQVKSA